jgi:hypothetical protein
MAKVHTTARKKASRRKMPPAMEVKTENPKPRPGESLEVHGKNKNSRDRGSNAGGGAAMKCSLLLVVLLMAAFALAAGNKVQEKIQKVPSAQVVDSGSFGIFVNGKRIATERFQIEQRPEVSIVTSEIRVDDGTSQAEQTSEMQVAPNGELRVYKWRATIPAKEESTVEPKDQFLVEHFTTADQKKRDIPYILPLSTVILDDNFFVHREVLVWRYLATGCVPKNNQLACGPSHFGVLVPRQHTAGVVVVELLGREKITVKGAQVDLNKVKLNADGVEWLLWVDEPQNNYKVIKMAIPSGNVEVWRD